MTDPLSDEREPSAWDRAVAAHESTLVVGARVKCMPGEGCSVAFWGAYGVRGHPDEIAGATGTITSTSPSFFAPWSDTHPYCVTFDQPRWVQIQDGGPSKRAEGNYFCAAELILLDDAP